jgi:hypothetical protein
MDPVEGKTEAKPFAVDMEYDAEVDDNEPTEEEFRASIRRSMRQALSGETRPADEALEAIRRELAANAEARQDN